MQVSDKITLLNCRGIEGDQQWYCPYCGPRDSALTEFPNGFAECYECGRDMRRGLPPFVTAMQDRIAELEAQLESAPCQM